MKGCETGPPDWQRMFAAEYDAHQETEMMLAVATDVAMQRGKALDKVYDIVIGKFNYIEPEDITERLEEIVADADG